MSGCINAGERGVIAEILAWVVELVELLGYWGIFIATFLESTFVPLPSEVTIGWVGIP